MQVATTIASIGIAAAFVCYFAVTVLKRALKYDDSLDVFGIHGVGGIVGALGTAIVYAPGLGGPGGADYAIGGQFVTQVLAVGTTIVWAGVGTAIAITVAKALTGLRVSEEVEREGLDLGEHGERAYTY